MAIEERVDSIQQQVKKVEEKQETISTQIGKLETEYHDDKKEFLVWRKVLGFCLVAFLGITFVGIPAIVREQLNTIVGRETIKTIQEYKDQIAEQAKQIEQYATSAKDDINEIGKIRKNLEDDVSYLTFTNCGEQYSCTPQACLARCIELGLGMATYDEVYSWASSGKDHCAYMWMLDSKQSDTSVFGYPMYHNQTTEKTCGRTNTGDIPRIEGLISSETWESQKKFDCACVRFIDR